MKNPRMLYRPGVEIRVWNKYDVDTLVVAEDEVEERLAEGWHLRPGDWERGSEKKADDQKAATPKGKRGRGTAPTTPESSAASDADASGSEKKADA